MRYRAGVRARSVALRANLRLLFLAPATVLESLRPSRFGLRPPASRASVELDFVSQEEGGMAVSAV